MGKKYKKNCEGKKLIQKGKLPMLKKNGDIVNG